MRIAQVSPLFESVPPKQYGGTEAVVSHLTEELVRLGHHVTLFASGDSVTEARLEAVVGRSLRLNPECIDYQAPHALQMARLVKLRQQFDVIHFHIDYGHYLLSRVLSLPSVTTLHGRLNIPELQPLYREFSETPVVSISNAQRKPLPAANWVATVYHGLPEAQFRFAPEAGRYLAFLGRISPEKRVDRAIDLAIRFGMPLKIAAKVDKADREYYESEIRPLLRHPLVEYLGEIGNEDKSAFLGGAYALLLPIDWPEPFGLVMIEAMACGTPTIAWCHGSVPEIISSGVNGFVVRNRTAALAALARVPQIDRAACRRVFEERFTALRMARDYLDVYAQIASQPPQRMATPSLKRIAG